MRGENSDGQDGEAGQPQRPHQEDPRDDLARGGEDDGEHDIRDPSLGTSQTPRDLRGGGDILLNIYRFNKHCNCLKDLVCKYEDNRRWSCLFLGR